MGVFDKSQELLTDIDKLLGTGIGIYQKVTDKGKTSQTSESPGTLPAVLSDILRAYSTSGMVNPPPEAEKEIPWLLIGAGVVVLAIVYFR